MTAHTTEKPVRRAETGWARARRLRGRGVLRTYVPAVAETGTTPEAAPGSEGNIVRGED
ncbi:hypothetical protein [Streptomyces sp. NPDC046909]|uniref:hypothetical protein n=1 Tax=Streptomyces sp. NPDC046909 TaxID=3155617 RepID=UPI0033FE3D7F